ncbi:hypothetical protein BP6252_03909 [Coleophoma cylindrospora]|uniref:Uncharacterized protein n=1 Tax=Coleophoma cylindrospora TaxID=1849047 RepID=A0A3D8S8W1_9HELO|nr:hypothetical protein BP6252_03909 [Coleophoma cylindrospora]
MQGSLTIKDLDSGKDKMKQGNTQSKDTQSADGHGSPADQHGYGCRLEAGPMLILQQDTCRRTVVGNFPAQHFYDGVGAWKHDPVLMSPAPSCLAVSDVLPGLSPRPHDEPLPNQFLAFAFPLLLTYDT